MKPYIWMNTELPKRTTSDFKKHLYKLMNNAVLSNTVENLQEQVDVKLTRACEEDKTKHLIASSAFALQVHKSRSVLKHSVYLGMSTLDLSKNLMHD